MPFSHHAAADPIRSDITEAFRREWDRLARPGASLSGAERIAVAATARGDRQNAPAAGVRDSIATAAQIVATAPATITRSWVEELTSGDVTAAEYVEVVGVVSRIAAVDAFHRIVDLPPEPLPDPVAGPPTGDIDSAATAGSRTFVPMTRGASIWWALTLVPAEYQAMADFHCVLYLSPEEMQRIDSPRTLTRPQIELLASRVSLLNECFY